jgi:ribonucleoside-diphosphate reductase alpha chain
VIKEGRKTKEQVSVWSYEMLLYKEMFGTEEIPEWFSVADNVDNDGHIAIQSAVQKWTDSSVSKTVNVPSDIAFEDFKDLYIKGYEHGLKGLTTFRFNPDVFTGVLVREDDLESTTYVFETENGDVIKAKGSDTIEYDGEEHNAANLFDAIKENTYGKY